MKRIVFIILILSAFVLTAIVTSYAAGPAPYTESALNDIGYSAKRIGVPVPPVGATKEETVKYFINYYLKIYSNAGYSLEKSIVQYSNDLNKDPDFMSKGFYAKTAALTVTLFSAQINGFRKEERTKIYVDKLLSKDTVKSLDNILAIEQKKENIKKAEQERYRLAAEAEQKAAEEKAEAEKRAHEEEMAKKQKENTLMEKQYINKNMTGHFVNSYTDKNSRLDIKFIAEDKVSFTLLITKNNHICKFDNQEASLKKEPGYSSPYSLIYDNESDVKSNTDSCTIIMNFVESSEKVKEIQKSDYYYVLNQRGKCSTYCERGGYVDGRYKKTE